MMIRQLVRRSLAAVMVAGAAWGCASSGGAPSPGPTPGAVQPPEDKIYINPGTMVKPDGVSQAVRVGRTVYVSGQVALDHNGDIVGGDDLKAQAARAFENLDSLLSVATARAQDVVRLTVYVVDLKPEDLGALRQAAPRYFPDRDAPATTFVGVASLYRPGLKVAVDAVAILRPQATRAPIGSGADASRRTPGGF